MLLELFERCLKANYIHTANGGDYAIETEGDTLYLLFEWSRGIEDWRANFNFPAKPYKRMDCVWYCHRGFLNVWKGMRDEIEAKVKDILFHNAKIKNIVCVGYSHGGPLALLCTEDIEYLYGHSFKITGYGFGSPRVLWGVVPKSVKERLRNFNVIRNIPDLVTHLPPMIFGFRNVGNLIKIGWVGPIKSHFPGAYKKELGSGLCEEYTTGL